MAESVRESYGTGGNSNYTGPDDNLYFGQSFTTTGNYNTTSVRLRCWRNGTPGNMTVSIRATSSNLPTGGNLATAVVDANNFQTTEQWEAFTFSTPYELANATKYAIVGTIAASWVAVDWYNPGSYADGNRLYSDDGTNWSGDTVRDFSFQVWGEDIVISGNSWRDVLQVIASKNNIISNNSTI